MTRNEFTKIVDRAIDRVTKMQSWYSCHALKNENVKHEYNVMMRPDNPKGSAWLDNAYVWDQELSEAIEIQDMRVMLLTLFKSIVLSDDKLLGEL